VLSFHDPISGSTPCPNAGLTTIKAAIASLFIMLVIPELAVTV
jgi:hypothetical protein